MANERVMVVEDDVIIANAIEHSLVGFGYSVPALASSGESAIEQAGKVHPDLVLMDIRLSGEMDGIEAADRIRLLHGIPVVFLTAYASDELLARAKHTQPYGYLVKPFHDRDLHSTVQMALYKHQMDRRLKESEERYHAVMQQAFDGILLLDPHTLGLLESNMAFLTMLGYGEEEIQGLAMGDLATKDVEDFGRDIRQVLSEKGCVLGERRIRRKDGSSMDVWVSGAVIPEAGRDLICLALHDLSEQKRAQEEKRLLEAYLHYAQKMESLGTMAGAVAHTFNNLLCAILGNAEMLQLSQPLDLEARGMLQAITSSGMRAVEIVKQIMAYTGHMPIKRERVDLSVLLLEMSPMLEAAITGGIVFRCELPQGLPPIMVDMNQIRQVIMNLFTNAVEAMREGEGVITLTAGAMEADRSMLSEPYLPENLAEGRYVTLEIADTGTGMDEVTMERAFDPFFSTKFPGRGLGLSAVLGIVRRSRGFIKVYSKKGEGARILLGFPAAD